MLERVVVTGMGIVSCLGNDARTVRDALFEGKVWDQTVSGAH